MNVMLRSMYHLETHQLQLSLKQRLKEFCGCDEEIIWKYEAPACDVLPLRISLRDAVGNVTFNYSSWHLFFSNVQMITLAIYKTQSKVS